LKSSRDELPIFGDQGREEIAGFPEVGYSGSFRWKCIKGYRESVVFIFILVGHCFDGRRFLWDSFAGKMEKIDEGPGCSANCIVRDCGGLAAVGGALPVVIRGGNVSGMERLEGTGEGFCLSLSPNPFCGTDNPLIKLLFACLTSNRLLHMVSRSFEIEMVSGFKKTSVPVIAAR
jgi:hypothetical protein